MGVGDDCVWDIVFGNVDDGAEAPNELTGFFAGARVIDHVGGKNCAELGIFFFINQEVESIKQILDVRLVLEFASSEDENDEGTEEGEDLKSHLVNWMIDIWWA